ncbi:MAG TPA: GspH/FimT family pseudopilin [Rudaea sp.]
MNTKKRQAGITLVEILTTLAIAATLLSVSLPAFGGLIHRTQSRVASEALTASLNLARMTAVNRQRDVVVCPSRDHAHCDDSLWWQNGWIVFVDSDRDGKRGDDETLIETADAKTGLAIASTAGRKHVTYRSDGSAPGTNLTLTVCDRSGADKASTIVVNNAGRVRSGRAAAGEAETACGGLVAGS